MSQQEKIERLKFDIQQAMLDYGRAFKDGYGARIQESTERCVKLLDGLAALRDERIEALKECLAAQKSIVLAAKARIAELELENFGLAAGQCANVVGDEGGTPRCAEIGRLRAALERIADPRNTLFAGDAQVVARETLAGS